MFIILDLCSHNVFPCTIGLVLCGYLLGLDIIRDRDIHYDLRRIGCSNFVMLINCLGLVYSCSPLKTALYNDSLHAMEYVYLVLILIDIVLRVVYSAVWFWIANNLQSPESQTSVIKHSTPLYYLSTLKHMVFSSYTKLYSEIFYSIPIEESVYRI